VEYILKLKYKLFIPCTDVCNNAAIKYHVYVYTLVSGLLLLQP